MSVHTRVLENKVC